MTDETFHGKDVESSINAGSQPVVLDIFGLPMKRWVPPVPPRWGVILWWPNGKTPRFLVNPRDGAGRN